MSIIQICKKTGVSFKITDEDREYYAKMNVPQPTLSPDERLRRRLTWRNDSTLYRRTCSSTGTPIISMFSPNAPAPIYEHDVWWSDSWDPLSYGQKYDFNRPFFEQFQELNNRVPQINLINMNNENCPYSNYTGWNKNCYLCVAGNYTQDSFYSYNAEKCSDCSDCLFSFNCELCYECVHCEGLYNCCFCFNSKNCQDSFFLEDCTGCRNCLFCWNLSHKEFYIFNKQYTKEEYFEKLKQLKLNTREGLESTRKIWLEERVKYPKRETHNMQAEDCTGDYISNCKKCRECFIMFPGSEDCKFVFNGFPNLKDSYDCCYCGENASQMYECMGTGGNTSMILFGNLCLAGSSDLYYCNTVFNVKNSFGCSNLRNKSYCILNKQYTKEEYIDVLPRIIKHMKTTGEFGEFFPAEISPFKYEETQAKNFF